MIVLVEKIMKVRWETMVTKDENKPQDKSYRLVFYKKPFTSHDSLSALKSYGDFFDNGSSGDSHKLPESVFYFDSEDAARFQLDTFRNASISEWECIELQFLPVHESEPAFIASLQNSEAYNKIMSLFEKEHHVSYADIPLPAGAHLKLDTLANVPTFSLPRIRGVYDTNFSNNFELRLGIPGNPSNEYPAQYNVYVNTPDILGSKWLRAYSTNSLKELNSTLPKLERLYFIANLSMIDCSIPDKKKSYVISWDENGVSKSMPKEEYEKSFLKPASAYQLSVHMACRQEPRIKGSNDWAYTLPTTKEECSSIKYLLSRGYNPDDIANVVYRFSPLMPSKAVAKKRVVKVSKEAEARIV